LERKRKLERKLSKREGESSILPILRGRSYRSQRPDLLQPHILRSLANIKVTSIHTSAGGCHCIVLDCDGTAWLFGRNNNCALGVTGVDEVSENAPKHVTPNQLRAPKGTRFVHAACGRTHSLLVGSGGELWSVGWNNFGQVTLLCTLLWSSWC
jgi:alpha-tubulin suppressor-like RCC1 family protein